VVITDLVLPPVLTSRQKNVLVQIIDEAPQALIADFGLAIVTRNPDSIRTATRQPCNIARWTAPEVLNGANPTKESDIYSFAMVMIEVRSG
jgi:serine/threonine protein kinase